MAVDERKLAQQGGALVGGYVRPPDVLAAPGAHFDRAAVLEAQLEIAYDGSEQNEGASRANDPLGSPEVGGREDLLGRHVGDELVSPRGRGASGDPDGFRDQTDRQIRSGAAE